MAKRNKNIKWINRYSREEGFVKAIRKSEGFFENTFSQPEARRYSQAEAESAVSTLHEIGEAENNEFSIVEA